LRGFFYARKRRIRRENSHSRIIYPTFATTGSLLPEIPPALRGPFMITAMTHYVLCDSDFREQLLPFTYTRPVAECRVGLTTLREKWESLLGQQTSTLTTPYLASSYPLQVQEDTIWINSALLPDAPLLAALGELQRGEALYAGPQWLIARAPDPPFAVSPPLTRKSYCFPFRMIRHPWDICQMNDELLRQDFARITAGRSGQAPDPSNQVIGPEQLFIEPDAEIRAASLNCSTGPIYIGRGATVMEGARIRGPFALGEGGVVKMGTNIYGATTIGPHCVVGGEIKNCVLFGYSNKAHDGYLGDSVIGEWCNLGAGTCCSNLKNNLKPVRIWQESTQTSEPAGLRCGLLMGDFSRTGIAMRFNTGSVVGVSCHIFGEAFPPTYVPSCCWGGGKTFSEYRLPNLLQDAAAWKNLKARSLEENESAILTEVFHQTLAYRKLFLS